MKLGRTMGGLLRRGEKGLVPFFTAGYPDEATFLACLRAAARAGCPAVEVGIPFSDPLADGPAIQESSQAALAGGMTLRRALDIVATADLPRETAIVFMSYLNPLLRCGVDRFAQEAAAAGVCGAILPDVPLEESAGIRDELAGAGVTLVDLVAPTSGPERVERICRIAAGFLYLVAVTGVTGARASLDGRLPDLVARVRARTELPLYVGFGVSSPAQAAEVVRLADGVVIGSALVGILGTAVEGGASARRRAVGEVERFLTRVQRAIGAATARAGEART